MARGDVLTDAEARYLEQIWADCEGWLGPGTELIDVLSEAVDEGVRLVVRYRLGERVRESDAVGETLLEAHGVLRAKIVFDRIRYGTAHIFNRGW